MPILRQRDDDGDDGRCRECEKAIASGPCASCEAMICPDCGVMSRDPTGRRVICLSCARLVADVESKKKPRRTPSQIWIALLVLIAFGAGVLALLSP